MPHRLLESTAGAPIKAWLGDLELCPKAEQQLRAVARLPIIAGWLAAMPDVHWGLGATVGSVIPTAGAIIPAAVGVDIGCGMIAARTSLKGDDLPDDLAAMRRRIEQGVPVGFDDFGKSGTFRKGRGELRAERAWRPLAAGFESILAAHPSLEKRRAPWSQLGTLGGGNHFIEICLDADGAVWVLLHSGSRGIGNKIGQHFIALAKKDMKAHLADLPDRDLAYFSEGTAHHDEYVAAVGWAQDYARLNRQLMLETVLEAMADVKGVPPFRSDLEVVNCHHNYVARERHFDREVWITRKGAVRAGTGEMGIIPGSMGARSYIVRGKGCKDSYESCSHGAGRAMSRGEARRRITLDAHRLATEGVECRKDEGVLDESPQAYKPIDRVMAAQADLVEIVHELRQIVCIKG